VVSEERELLLRTAERIFVGLATSERLAEAERGVWDAEGWRMIEDAGLPLAFVPEERGGVGFAPADALAPSSCPPTGWSGARGRGGRR
jgi:acyl-CoA dehydrogenase